MSWTEYQTKQDPDLPVRADDLAAQQDAVTLGHEGPVEKSKNLEELADRLLLPLTWLEEVDWLLEDRRAIIFTGPPGSGKTYLARMLAEHYAPQGYQFLQFHSSYTYEDFVEGYRPVTTVNGELRYAVVPGPLREVATAAAGSDDLHVLVLDEINRANLSKVLGELFFGLEYRDVPVRAQYSPELVIPTNLLFIGTMNTADRSISSFDAALRRRFHFVNCDPTKPPFDGLLRRYLRRHGLGHMDWLAKLLEEANNRIPDPNYSVGPSHFMKPDITAKDAGRIWTHSVWPYLAARFDPAAISDLRWEELLLVHAGAISEPEAWDASWSPASIEVASASEEGPLNYVDRE